MSKSKTTPPRLGFIKRAWILACNPFTWPCRCPECGADMECTGYTPMVSEWGV